MDTQERYKATRKIYQDLIKRLKPTTKVTSEWKLSQKICKKSDKLFEEILKQSEKEKSKKVSPELRFKELHNNVEHVYRIIREKLGSQNAFETCLQVDPNGTLYESLQNDESLWKKAPKAEINQKIADAYLKLLQDPESI